MQEIPLEKEQEELLVALVEAARNVPREERQKFHALWAGYSMPQDIVVHQGFPGGQFRAYRGDLEILARKGLIVLTDGQNRTLLFDVAPEGFLYYEHLRRQAAEPLARMETAVKSYLDSGPLASEYSGAYRAWQAAEKLLWGADTRETFTAIGHACREAMQLFCTELVTRHSPQDVDPDPAHTVARLKAILSVRRSSVSADVHALLEALLVYWGTVSDLVQRQEHGAQKEGRPLRWEDARRVVFHAAIVMYELDRALSGS